MTNEFAIKVLTELRGYGDKFANIGFDRKEALDLAIKVLEQTRWIPCSEKLPEEADVYLVSMNRFGYPQREVDGFVCGRWERFGNDVIAWCKIPEPYKTESEDEE